MKKVVYMNTIRDAVLRRLNEARERRQITRQQYRTLRGQIFNGDPLAAMRGLRKILDRTENSKN